VFPGEVDTFTTAMDLFPTIAEFIGVELPDDRIYDGVSLMPLFQGEGVERDTDEAFYYYNACNLQAVKKGSWKLHLSRTKLEKPWWDKSKEFIDISVPVLFNTDEDLAEKKNVAGAHPKIVAELLALAEEKKEEFGEYLKRGSQQRPTGTLFDEVPVITNERDWNQLSDEEKGRGKTEFLKPQKKKKEKRKKPKYES